MKNSAAPKRSPSTETAFGSEVSASLLDAKDGNFLVLDFKQEVDPIQWARKYKTLVTSLLVDHGVIYLRDAGIKKDDVVRVVSELLPEGALMDSYRGGVTGRPRVAESLFLATEIPGEGPILQHHEMSYLASFPKKVFFYCNKPADHGGATPVAFSRRVTKDLSKDVFKEFKRRGVCYIRNYYPQVEAGSPVLLSWKKAFEVQSKAEMERAIKAMGFKYEWVGDQLRTANTRPATILHPLTGEEFIFNHSYVLHTYSEKGKLCPNARGPGLCYTEEENDFLATLKPMDHPYLATWGDNGEVIGADVLEELFQCYNSRKEAINWKKGDLMIVDNILASHGRDQFLGKRETLALLSKA